MPHFQKEVALKSSTKRGKRAFQPERRISKEGSNPLLQAQNASGVPDAEAATILVAQAAGMPAGRVETGLENAKVQVQTAMHMLEQIKPEGALQSMLAVQMIGVHNSAVKFLMSAIDENQTFEGMDANVHRAVRLFRLFNEQLQALASLRGKTARQKVTVEHVHVHEGGQAIVGNLSNIADPPRGEGNGVRAETP